MRFFLEAFMTFCQMLEMRCFIFKCNFATMIFNGFMNFTLMTDKECFKGNLVTFFQVSDERYFILISFLALTPNGTFENAWPLPTMELLKVADNILFFCHFWLWVDIRVPIFSMAILVCNFVYALIFGLNII